MDVAPPYPPFQGHLPKTRKCDNLQPVVNLLNGRDSPGSTTEAMSSGKRAHVSGQYLEQLERGLRVYISLESYQLRSLNNRGYFHLESLTLKMQYIMYLLCIIIICSGIHSLACIHKSHLL